MESTTIGRPVMEDDHDENRSIFGRMVTTDCCGDTMSVTTDTDKFVSDTTAYYFKIIVYISLTSGVGLMGVVTNIINIIIFIRQGILTDSSTAGLLGLAVSDFCCVTTMLWLCASLVIVLHEPPGLSWDPWDVHYITAAWPHLMFTQTTRVITAYITFERCFCVVFPFKVRTVFTPSRSVAIIVGIFIFTGLLYSPVFISERLKYKTDPITNVTELVLVSAPYWEEVVHYVYTINSICFNLCSVITVFICTMIIVIRLKISKSWRKSVAVQTYVKPEITSVTQITSDSQLSTPTDDPSTADISNEEKKINVPGGMSKTKMQRERKLVRLIIAISVLFMICYIPDFLYLTINAFIYEVRILGTYDNLAMVIYSFTFFMETVSSTINIFIYYTMSSRFRKEFQILFNRSKEY